MTKVFAGGSRHVSRLGADVRGRLDRIVEKEFQILVGDANGADKAVQRYLEQRKYRRVEVFCSGAECRNNIGGWPERHIPVANGERGFAFYAVKDAAMAVEASVGLMLWDGKSVGTLVNVFRLVSLGKTTVVYVVPWKRFVDRQDERALGGAPRELRSGDPARFRAQGRFSRRSASVSTGRPLLKDGSPKWLTMIASTKRIVMRFVSTGRARA